MLRILSQGLRKKKRRRSFHLAGVMTQQFVSRVLSLHEVALVKPMIIPLGRASPRVSCGLPRGSGGLPSDAPLRGLAPDGVCLPLEVPPSAGGPALTFSSKTWSERRMRARLTRSRESLGSVAPPRAPFRRNA